MGDGGEGKGKGRGEERERAGNPQNLYVAYAHGLCDPQKLIES
jgi:hypothetical protein